MTQPISKRVDKVEVNSITVGPDAIVEQTQKAKDEGFRFVTASCVDIDAESVEILYHFDKNLELRNLRMTVAKGKPAPSISSVYFAAFLIENEILDQFGIEFDGLVLDFGGTLYLEDESEVTRTPFCKYGVVRKDAADKAETGADKTA